MAIKYTVIGSKQSGYEIKASGKWPRGKLNALKESIRKWEYVVAVLSVKGQTGVPDADSPSCALCKCFIGRLWSYTKCRGCPVREYTGRMGCEKTPFVEYSSLSKSGFGTNVKKALAVARREVAFLKKLVPIVEAEMKVKSPKKKTRSRK